jgi:1,4-dihydroxy-2-naphthoate octaprenyltransferase
VRDRETDRSANKRTLVARFGRGAGTLEYGLLLALSYGVVGSLLGRGVLGAWGGLPLLTAPWAIGLFCRVLGDEGRALNAALVKTAQLLLLFGLSLAVGIVLDAGQ